MGWGLQNEPGKIAMKRDSSCSIAGSLLSRLRVRKEVCSMESVRMDSTVQLAEIKPGPEGSLARIAAPPPYADAKSRGATTGAIVYQDADECLTFGSAPERSGKLRWVETFGNNRLREIGRAHV